MIENYVVIEFGNWLCHSFRYAIRLSDFQNHLTGFDNYEEKMYSWKGLLIIEYYHRKEKFYPKQVKQNEIEYEVFHFIDYISRYRF